MRFKFVALITLGVILLLLLISVISYVVLKEVRTQQEEEQKNINNCFDNNGIVVREKGVFVDCVSKHGS